jgi:hypothetical protein
MTLNRRQFVVLSSSLAAIGCSRAVSARNPEATADVVIVGGSTGGVAAALAACRAGTRKVILTEETAWIGGQLTAQIVPPDEHKWIESTGATKSYRDYRDAVRTVYRTRKDRPLRADQRGVEHLNPGNGWVSRLCHEPKVGLDVLEAMLKPYVASGQLSILRHFVPVAADVDGDRVRSVTMKHLREGQQITLSGRYFLDATDEGDLLPLTKTEFVTGSESRADTGEPNASDTARPGNVQSFTWCMALEYRDGEEHVIEKPREYDFWKTHAPDGQTPLFNWEKPKFAFYPKGERDPADLKLMNFWTYRRVVDAKKFAPGSYAGDVAVVNYHQNDYALGSLHMSDTETAAKHRDRSRQMSLSLLYWLQTECPRSDGKAGWPGLKLAPSQTGSADGLALAPYIRESRRIVPQFRILEQHVSRPLREKELGKENARALEYKDSVGVGHYLYMDLHQTCEGEKKGGWPVFPFQIPLGALIPQRVTNVLAACKNLGVTHLTNGCYRLHPVEWNIGEAAGALAAFCVAHDRAPKQVRATAAHLADYQKLLMDQGFVLEWPADAIRG